MEHICKNVTEILGDFLHPLQKYCDLKGDTSNLASTVQLDVRITNILGKMFWEPVS